MTVKILSTQFEASSTRIANCHFICIIYYCVLLNKAYKVQISFDNYSQLVFNYAGVERNGFLQVFENLSSTLNWLGLRTDSVLS